MNFLFGLILCALMGSTFNSVPRAPFKGAAEGDEWLKWNGDTRLVYVGAYAAGFDRGFVDGCRTAGELEPRSRATGLPGEECIAKEPGYPKTLEEYVDAVTKFYDSYPTDRYVPIRRVLDGLSDARNLTIQQIHQYSSEGSQSPKP